MGRRTRKTVVDLTLSDEDEDDEENEADKKEAKKDKKVKEVKKTAVLPDISDPKIGQGSVPTVTTN